MTEIRIKTLTLHPHLPNFSTEIESRKKEPFSPSTVLFFFLLVFSMDDFRSRSYADGRMQIEPNGGSRGPPLPLHDLRSYSTSHASAYSQKEVKLKKGKSDSSSKSGWLSDPELQRKKRVAGYKVYSVEGKVKGSFRKSFRWIKDRYAQVVYGWW